MLLTDEAAASMAQRLEVDDFFHPGHRLLFKAFRAILDRNKPLDMLVIEEELKAEGTLADIGGPDYLLEIAAYTPSAANAKHYADIVREKRSLRDDTVAAKALIGMVREGANHAARLKYKESLLRSKGTDNDGLSFDVKPLEHYEVEEARFLWEPYIRLGQINLLDAKGGSGKTTLCVAIAVQGSLGNIPWRGECEPFKTLYFGTEDTPGELRKLYVQMGGKEGFLIPMMEPFQLTDENLKRVKATILKTGAKFVVFDAVTYYVGNLIRNPLNGMEIAPFLGKLRDVARATDSAIVDIRHFKQGTAGKDVADMGNGSEQWRNSHRSQLVLRPHPDKVRYGIIEHTKGSLNAPKGDPFGFQFINGSFGWVPPSEIDLSVFDKDREVTTDGAMEASEAVDWLKEFLSEGPRASKDVFSSIEKAGGSRDLAYEAKRVLSVIAKQANNKGQRGSAGWTWELKEEALPYDEFA